MHNCPTCGVSCYKLNNNQCSDDDSTKNNRPTKVCWYLPIIPRFKRLFAIAEDAKYLRWHVDGRIIGGLLRHPADSPQ